MKVGVPVLDTVVEGKRVVNAHFGRSRSFAVVDVDSLEVEVVENPGLHLERGRGVLIAKMFAEKGVSAVLVKEIGPGAFDKIKNALGIEIYLVPREVKFLEDAVKMFREGKLQKLLEPNETHEH